MFSYNINDVGGTPKFQLIQNDNIVKEYQNTSIADGTSTTSVTLDLKEGDIFFGKMYGGGNNPTVFITSFYKISE